MFIERGADPVVAFVGADEELAGLYFAELNEQTGHRLYELVHLDSALLPVRTGQR